MQFTSALRVILVPPPEGCALTVGANGILLVVLKAFGLKGKKKKLNRTLSFPKK